jgi:hypothetical protein
MRIVTLLFAASLSAGTPKPIDVTAGDRVVLMRVYPDGRTICLAEPTPKELGALLTDGGKWLLIYADACGVKK